MVSILTMAANALGGLIFSALKAFFSLIYWFLKNFLNALKLFFCVLPLTSVVFVCLFALNIFLLVTGNISALNAGIQAAPNEIREEAGFLFSRGSTVTSGIFGDLFAWWNETIYIYHGKPAYIFLFILTVLMFLPVVSVLLCISVFAAYGVPLLMAICIDAAIYILLAVLGKSPVKQIQGRYFALFKEAGKKHDEKAYANWLRHHEYEAKSRKHGKREMEIDDFYEEDDDYEDDFYDEEDDEEYLEDDYYEDDYYEDEDFEDEDYMDEEDDTDEKESPSAPPLTRNNVFDFFAGCSSRESLDKKYKSLVKLYHPDNMDGDTSALQEINVQYANAKERF